MKTPLPSHINQYMSLINSIKKMDIKAGLENNFTETELLVKGNDFAEAILRRQS